MNINNSPSQKLSITIYSAKIEDDNSVTLEKLKGKAQTAALEAIRKNQLDNFAYSKNGQFVASKGLFSTGRTFNIKENGKTTNLSGRIRVMNESDVTEIKQFAAQYFAKMKQGEEKVEKSGKENRTWQPAKETDKKPGEVARRAIVTANERFEEESGKTNRTVEAKSNLETGKKIRRFYDQMKNKDQAIEEFNRKTRDNTIN